MKKILLFSIFLLGTFSLAAQEFPKCKEACDKFYDCSVQVNPNATEEQKSILRKGCNFNCNKPKYYSKIAACLTNSGETCKSFSNCIMKEMKAQK
ncbi:MAG: Cys-rich protein [Leptospira sp.]|jgi:Cys-rich protein (TIGR04453 family)|nr:Cys-rich protein [Leptospira sp.]